MAQVIYDGEHIQVLYDARGGETVLVTFNEMESYANGKTYWAESVARQAGLSCIGVMSKKKNWFPISDMLYAARIVTPIALSFKHRVTYGFSQGGYAAVRYSKALSATHVLSFSPQYSIDPLAVGDFDTRFAEHYRPELHADMAVNATNVSGVVLLVVDPRDKKDLRNALLIEEAIGRSCLVPCYNIGHGTVRTVASHAGFIALLRCSLHEDQAAVAGLLRRLKKDTYAYQFALGQAAIKFKHFKLASSLFRRAQKISAHHPYNVGWKKALRECGIAIDEL